MSAFNKLALGAVAAFAIYRKAKQRPTEPMKQLAFDAVKPVPDPVKQPASGAVMSTRKRRAAVANAAKARKPKARPPAKARASKNASKRSV